MVINHLYGSTDWINNITGVLIYDKRIPFISNVETEFFKHLFSSLAIP